MQVSTIRQPCSSSGALEATRRDGFCGLRGWGRWLCVGTKDVRGWLRICRPQAGGGGGGGGGGGTTDSRVGLRMCRKPPIPPHPHPPPGSIIRQD